MVRSLQFAFIAALILALASRCVAQDHSSLAHDYAVATNGEDSIPADPNFHGMLSVRHPGVDSLREEIAKLRRQLDEMSKQLKKLNEPEEDSCGILGWSLNSNGEFFGPEGLLDSNYFEHHPGGGEIQGKMPPGLHEFRFNGKSFVPPIPDLKLPKPQRIPRIEPKPSTPNPDFPGWKWQWLGGLCETRS